jgi:hypothetical protein
MTQHLTSEPAILILPVPNEISNHVLDKRAPMFYHSFSRFIASHIDLNVGASLRRLAVQISKASDTFNNLGSF